MEGTLVLNKDAERERDRQTDRQKKGKKMDKIRKRCFFFSRKTV